jgi:ABC-2 type transport system permease protein
MRSLYKLAWVELKLFLREPAAAFFTLVFPLIVLVASGSIFGNQAGPDGRGAVDISTPGYIALIIGTTGLMSVPVALGTYREKGILRRFRATPLRPSTVLGAQVLVNFAVTALGVALLLTAARLLYGLQTPAAPLALVLAFCLASFSFMAAGFILAGLMPTARAAQTVGMALFYPMMFLSGAAMPRQFMPATIQRISEFLPLTHVTILIADLWTGEGWSLVSLAVLSAMLLAGVAVSARTFRWE